jgi:hypothetical protein
VRATLIIRRCCPVRVRRLDETANALGDRVEPAGRPQHRTSSQHCSATGAGEQAAISGDPRSDRADSGLNGRSSPSGRLHEHLRIDPIESGPDSHR